MKEQRRATTLLAPALLRSSSGAGAASAFALVFPAPLILSNYYSALKERKRTKAQSGVRLGFVESFQIIKRSATGAHIWWEGAALRARLRRLIAWRCDQTNRLDRTNGMPAAGIGDELQMSNAEQVTAKINIKNRKG